jgi:hypothetical protein
VQTTTTTSDGKTFTANKVQRHGCYQPTPMGNTPYGHSIIITELLTWVHGRMGLVALHDRVQTWQQPQTARHSQPIKCKDMDATDQHQWGTPLMAILYLWERYWHGYKEGTCCCTNSSNKWNVQLEGACCRRTSARATANEEWDSSFALSLRSVGNEPLYTADQTKRRSDTLYSRRAITTRANTMTTGKFQDWVVRVELF